VVQSARRKAPKATWTSAEKRTTKKQGVVYILHGKISNQTATLTISSSGEVLQFTQGSLRGGKEGSLRGGKEGSLRGGKKKPK
jgi:hypothetical protein